MSAQFWLLIVGCGAAFFGFAISVASKIATWVGAVILVVGLIGLGTYFFNGSEKAVVDPPDVGTPSQK
ncbi:hypothetical protein SAMN03159496_06008 [Rhizobium sp. NFR07]|uniref:hypothetical protein n=1 Tax=Rhizobium sp. NFR07 TaxID=1566262 RepID=UPI0008E3ABE2|nr:hypothetical protein [Rhizobium sp. NFR07]SFB62388.1 hypothetical protein SAMN03159496_06008 [Rhizobium sp. NFR07]